MMNNPTPLHPILLADDEPGALESLTIALEFMGYTNVLACSNPQEIPTILEQHEIEAALLDLIMPGVSGDELLDLIMLKHPGIPVIMVTAVNDLDTAVRCMRKGAIDYITKPIDTNRLAATLHKAMERRAINRELDVFKRNTLCPPKGVPEPFSAFLTRDADVLNILRYCEAVAASSQPVLITGETGTGKELVAQGIHKASGRGGPFVAVNVAGLGDHEFSDVLFGHKKGAFTGADQSRLGLIEKAASGTLFLDEIGDLSDASQVKLLRALQEGEFYPLGSDVPIMSTARIVAATNMDLQHGQESGTFRSDLFFRLKTHTVHLPPLRERKDDLAVLLEHFIAVASEELGKKAPHLPRELVTLLAAHPFHGNIRELKAMVHDAVSINTTPTLSMASFKKAVHASPNLNAQPAGDVQDLFRELDTLPTLRQAADVLVDEAMRRYNQNQRQASSALCISPSALNKRLHQR